MKKDKCKHLHPLHATYQRHLLLQSHLKRRMREARDRLYRSKVSFKSQYNLARLRQLTSSVLYMLIATPLPLKSYTSKTVFSPVGGVNTSWSLPGPGARKSVLRYWSPKAWRPMTIGFVQPGTGFGMRLRMMGSRKTVPPRMLRI